MRYYYDSENDWYVISINRYMNDALFQKTIREILKEEGIDNLLYF